MPYIESLIVNFVQLTMEASPWLLLGLLIAGLMKYWLPAKILSRHLGSGVSAIFKAALIGAPLPLCSCGVIPVATELSRSGASKPATAAFLVATPETGVDSVSISYAMLGPVFAIYRPISAILSAIFTGLLVTFDKSPRNEQPCQTKSCCAHEHNKTPEPNKVQTPSAFKKTLNGIQYAATKLVDDIIVWLFIGLVFATLVKTFIPTSFLLHYGSGLPAMLMMIVISIPMYICATASTPIAAGLILAGISPGTALVFMMAGPATNISTLGIIRNELGSKTLVLYLTGITLSALGFGYLLDWLVTWYAIDITEHMQHSHAVVPEFIALVSSVLLAFLAIKPLRSVFIKTLH